MCEPCGDLPTLPVVTAAKKTKCLRGRVVWSCGKPNVCGDACDDVSGAGRVVVICGAVHPSLARPRFKAPEQIGRLPGATYISVATAICFLAKGIGGAVAGRPIQDLKGWYGPG